MRLLGIYKLLTSLYYGAVQFRVRSLFDDSYCYSQPHDPFVLLVSWHALMNESRTASVYAANCGFCKRSTPWVEEAIEKYGNDVRFIFKELPILDDRTKTSRLASRAALAAEKQGKYMDMHLALMKQKRLSGEIIRETAEEIGLDMRRYEADMGDPTIEQHISDTLELANRLPALTGTPFFVIGDEYVSGADTARLNQLVKAGL